MRTSPAADSTFQPPALHVSARWERALVSTDGGEAILMVTISAVPVFTTQERRSPVDIAFVIDRSGSMGDGKLELAKKAVLTGLALLRPDDRATLVSYDHEVAILHRLSALDARSISRLKRVLREIDTGGSTNLSDGWLAGCDQLATSMGGQGRTRIRRALLLTDGQANMGIVDPGQLMSHATELRKRGISTTTLGVGDDFDEVLLSGMAEAGGGNFQYIARSSQLPAFFKEELGELLTVVAMGLKLRLTLPHGVRANLVNAFPADRSGKQIDVTVGDLPASTNLNLVFQMTVKPGSVRVAHAISVAATWADPATDRTHQVDVDLEPLLLATRYDVDRAPRDHEVSEEVAIQIAAANEREAMRLDLEGRHTESRDMLASSAAMLMAAPDSVRISELHSHISDLAEYNSALGFASGVRKQSTSDAMRRSRGRKEAPDSSPT